jgi:hypothetical protein
VSIEEICGSVERLDPVNRRLAALKEQGVNNIIDSAERTLGFTILLRCMRAGHAENGAVREEERAGRGVVKLAAIVALDGLDGGAKLRAYISKKVRDGSEGVEFKTQRECPSIMRIIINNNEIIFVTGHTNNWRCPKITMY